MYLISIAVEIIIFLFVTLEFLFVWPINEIFIQESFSRSHSGMYGYNDSLFLYTNVTMKFLHKLICEWVFIHCIYSLYYYHEPW